MTILVNMGCFINKFVADQGGEEGQAKTQNENGGCFGDDSERKKNLHIR